MVDDDLNQPLGLALPPPGRGRRQKTMVAYGAGAALAGIALGVAGYFVFKPLGDAGPIAVAAIAPLPPVSTAKRPAGDVIASPGSGHEEGAASVENGVTVVRAKRGETPPGGPMIIKVPEALGLNEVAATNPDLIEMSRYGPLPKIGPGGVRPADLYARPLVFGTGARPGAPRIAIYIGGIGLDESTTHQAIINMPPPVSLAFAPYAAHLDETVKEAKAAGHEVLLQLPMESFAGRAGQPGPHTLFADTSRAALVDDLHWLMSRMTGYAGVTNFLGGKFTADKAAMTTVLEETGSRGLLYIDDGSSTRSLGPDLAPQLGVASARAEIVLDASPDPAAVRAALIKLEASAREKGAAIGMASGLPSALGPIAAFAATLAAKGISLVPVSALASTNPSSVALAP